MHSSWKWPSVLRIMRTLLYIMAISHYVKQWITMLVDHRVSWPSLLVFVASRCSPECLIYLRDSRNGPCGFQDSTWIPKNSFHCHLIVQFIDLHKSVTKTQLYNMWCSTLYWWRDELLSPSHGSPLTAGSSPECTKGPGSNTCLHHQWNRITNIRGVYWHCPRDSIPLRLTR